MLRIKLTEPAKDNRANQQLIQILAKFYNVSPSSIRICSGKHSKIKQLEIQTEAK